MRVSEQLDFDLHTVPSEIFDLPDSGLTLDSLTTGHGMAENGASFPTRWDFCSCGFSDSADEPMP